MPRLLSWLVPAAGLTALAAAMTILISGLTEDPATPEGKSGQPTFEWLVDPGSHLSLAEILANPDNDWKIWNRSGYLKAEERHALWLRVTISNPGPQPLRGILQDTEIYMDRVELWSQDNKGIWHQQVSGESIPLAEKPWRALKPAFSVDVPAAETRVVYLRVTDYYYAMSWWRWWPRMEDYFSSLFLESIIKGLGFGALAALLIYNLVLWLRLRFPDMGFYVGYAAGMTMFNFAECGGLAFFGHMVAPPLKIVVEVASLSVSAFFVITFTRMFLDLPSRLPQLNRALKMLAALWMVIFLGAFTMPLFGHDFWLSLAISGTAITHLILLGAAIHSWLQGCRAARFFVLAFGVLNLVGVPAAVFWMDGGNTHIFVLAILAACTLEMLLLSFAIADRFAQARQQLFEETEQRRLLEETYADELALEVSERTKDLEAANADKDRMLAVIGHDLRSPLTGLMRSADQATGIFAREASRTGRELLLMIEDLVLWARMRAGARTLSVFESRSVISPAVTLHHHIAENQGIHLEVKVPSNLRVETDLVLAQTLLRNLLANALKFARTRIILQATTVNQGVKFSIINDGPPISPEVLSRLASESNEPLTSTDGLGLRFCREICRELGLQLTAHSDSEGLTEFSFILPQA